MKRISACLPLCGLFLTALSVCACRIVGGKVDFSLAEDRFSRPVADTVVLESSSREVSNFKVVTPAEQPKEEAVAAAPTPTPAPVQPLTPTPAAEEHPVATTSRFRSVMQGVMHPFRRSAKTRTYTVKKGDTLARIAQSHGTTAQEIMAANKLKSTTRLQIGSNLIIPAAAAAKHTKGTAQAAGKYVIRKGDTLNAIAARHKVTPAALMKANGLTPAKADFLREGATLTIPASSR